MNHDQSEAIANAISLHEACLLAMDLENTSIINPREAESSLLFQRGVLQVLRKHKFTATDLSRLVIGDGIWTLFQYLRGNPDVPWNVLVLLRDWDSRFKITGYDFVAAWIEEQEFQGL